MTHPAAAPPSAENFNEFSSIGEVLPELVGAPPSVADQGFGVMRAQQGALPLSALRVKGRIVGLVSRLEVEQVFSNAFGVPIEATYIFPLPPGAAVTRFSMEVAGRVVKGELKRRDEAREVYTQAVARGQRAAMAEEERPDVFTMQVGNLMPGEQARVRLSLTGRLDCRGGEATFRFPLVVAPRYVPGRALPGAGAGVGIAADTDAVPDASRISPPVMLPGLPSPVRLSIEIEIEGGGLQVRDLRSSLHAVKTTSRAGITRVALLPGERLDRDFVLRFGVSGEKLDSALLLCPDADSDAGTFMLTLVPPARQGGLRPRDVIFVLDRSGSMGGWKMVAARRAVARMVEGLDPRDRFGIYAFDTLVESPPRLDGLELVPATEANRAVADDYLAKIEARGGTEMTEPLTQAVERLAGGHQDRTPVLVLVTDGQVGNEDQILRALSPKMKNVRVFTVGIDRAINEGFLTRLAQLGGGDFELVESEARLDEVMARIQRSIGAPVLTELRVDLDGVDVDRDTFAPQRLPDLFDGAPAIVTGRYRGAAGRRQIEAVIQGCDPRGGRVRQRVEARVVKDEAITTLWARGFVRALDDRLAAGAGDRFGIEQRLIEASLNFGVLSRLTAFVAVDGEVVNPGGGGARQVQPVEAPSGWGAGNTGSFACPAPSSAPLDRACARLVAPCPPPAPMQARARLASSGSPVRAQGMADAKVKSSFKKEAMASISTAPLLMADFEPSGPAPTVERTLAAPKPPAAPRAGRLRLLIALAALAALFGFIALLWALAALLSLI